MAKKWNEQEQGAKRRRSNQSTTKPQPAASNPNKNRKSTDTNKNSGKTAAKPAPKATPKAAPKQTKPKTVYYSNNKGSKGVASGVRAATRAAANTAVTQAEEKYPQTKGLRTLSRQAGARNYVTGRNIPLAMNRPKTFRQTVTPLEQMKADAVAGPKYWGSRTSIPSKPLTAEQQKKKNQQTAQRSGFNARARRQTLSQWDRKLPQGKQFQLQQAKQRYDEAKAKGDRAGMEKAHREAERLRYTSGYSGGVTGNERITPKLSQDNYNRLNSAGRLAMTQAQMTRDRAVTEEEIARADRRIEEILNAPGYRNGRKINTAKGMRETAEGRSTMLGATREQKEQDFASLPLATKAGFHMGVGSLGMWAENETKAMNDRASDQNMVRWFREADDYAAAKQALENYDSYVQQFGQPPEGVNRNVLVMRLNNAIQARAQLNRMWTDPQSAWYDSTQARRLGTPDVDAYSLIGRGDLDSPMQAMYKVGTHPDFENPEPSYWEQMYRKGQEEQAASEEGMNAAEKWANDLYISMLQNAPTTLSALIPGGQGGIMTGIATAARGLTLGAMGAGAEGARTLELMDQNIPFEEAKRHGKVSGAIEVATEGLSQLGLGRLVNGTAGKIIGQTWAQPLIEGLEETAAYLGNTGYSKAMNLPGQDFDWKELLSQTAAGTVMGALHTGAGVIVHDLRFGETKRVEASRADYLDWQDTAAKGRSLIAEGRQWNDMIEQGAVSREEGEAVLSQIAQQLTGIAFPVTRDWLAQQESLIDMEDLVVQGALSREEATGVREQILDRAAEPWKRQRQYQPRTPGYAREMYSRGMDMLAAQRQDENPVSVNPVEEAKRMTDEALRATDTEMARREAAQRSEEGDLFDSQTLPLATDEKTRTAQEKILRNEPLTLGEKLGDRDGKSIVKNLGDYQLKSDHAYRVIPLSQWEEYQADGKITRNIEEYVEGENNGGVDWYLGAAATRYGNKDTSVIILEAPARKDLFQLADDNGTRMVLDPTVRHIKSSSRANPVKLSDLTNVFRLDKQTGAVEKVTAGDLPRTVQAETPPVQWERSGLPPTSFLGAAIDARRESRARAEAEARMRSDQEAVRQVTPLEGIANNMGESGARSLTVLSERSPESVGNFVRVYNEAREGIASGIIPKGMSKAQYSAAFNAGRNDRAADMGWSMKAGVDWSNPAVRGMDRKALRAADGVAKALGTPLRIVGAGTAEIQTAGGETARGSIVGNEVFLWQDTKDPVREIVGHEFTHRTKDLNPEAYQSFEDYVMSIPGKDLAIKAVKERYARAGVRLSDARAREEVTADYAGELYRDSAEMQKFIRKNYENRTLLERVLDFFRYLHEKLTGREKAQADEAVRLLEEAIKGAEAKLEQRPKTQDAREELAGTVDVVTEVGVQIDPDTKSAAPIQFSLGSWNRSEYVQNRDEAAKVLAKQLKVSQKKAKQYIDDINAVANVIATNRLRLDYLSSPGRSSFVGNVEYGGSFDFNTICPKRRLYTGTIDAIQRAMPDKVLSADDMLKIRSRMKEKNYEVGCGLCYVEGSRVKIGKYTKEFLDELKSEGAEYVPSLAEMNTVEGQEDIRLNHPEVYQKYEKFMNKLAQRKPKLFQMSTEYDGEILKIFEGKEDSVKQKNRNGGIRMQSFSDFEVIHLIDTMQVIMDMSRVGLAGQAYAKQADFAWALGDTGLKINMSLIARGVDENGGLIFDEVEGIPLKDAMDLRDRYSQNVGSVVVVFNDQQLLAALADDRIDFVLPFHRSQWNKKQYGALGLPANTKDYTMQQNERYIKPVMRTNKNGKQVKARPSNYMPNEYWNFKKSGKWNAEKYLKMCAENNRRPKFHKLLVDNKDGSYSLQPDGSTDGYWKLLIDFKMYDNEGKGSPQKPVRPEFNMDEAKRMLDEYSGGHEKFPVAQDIVDEFVGGARFSISAEDGYNVSGNTASYTDERIDIVLKEYGGGGNYAQGFVTYINPRDFLKLTISDRTLARWENGLDKGMFPEEFFPLDEEKLRNNRQSPYLRVDTATGKVEGHEGRHRMLALAREGIAKAPVVLVDTATKYSKEPTAQMRLTSQDFGDGPVNGGYAVTVENLIPTNKQYRDQIKEAYGGEDARVRFSISPQADADYMAAVESGDMETAQRMVDEAAKKAGYDTPKIYHGTGAFGFTTFSPSKSDDGISLFATSNPMTAQTYSGETKRNRIKDRTTKNVDDLQGDELINEAKKHLKRYEEYRLLTKEEKAQIIEDARDDIFAAVESAARFISHNEDFFSTPPEDEYDVNRDELANKLVNSLSSLGAAKDYDSAQSYFSDYLDAIWSIKLIDEELVRDFEAEISVDTLHRAFNRLKDMTYDGDFFVEKNYPYMGYVFDNQVRIDLEAVLHRGVYELFGRTGKQLVIDAEGSNWNQIEPPEELNLYGLQRTRDIASAAKAIGYDSILFRDLKDNGGETPYNGISDVYVFFNANGLKSADPVTYDDNGNVIPLSERFNAEREDIRYSIGTHDSEGHELTEKQQEFFKDSEVRDDRGRLLRVYHGTPNGGFTVFDKGKSIDFGFYFTNKSKLAGTYSGTEKEYAPGGKDEATDIGAVNYVAYLNMKNPLWLDAYGTPNIESDEEFEGVEEDDVLPPWEWADIAKENGYDGVIIRDIMDAGGLFNGTDTGDIYIVFDSAQIKSVNNLNPTEDEDIRYSIGTHDSEGHELTEAQREFFKDSQVTDLKGNLLRVYHGTPSGGFTVFRDTDDIGYFFTRSRTVADTYSGGGPDFSPRRVNTWEEAQELAKEYMMDMYQEDGKWIMENETQRWEYDPSELKDAEDDLLWIFQDESVDYAGYLNLKNPLIVHGYGARWNNIVGRNAVNIEVKARKEDDIIVVYLKDENVEEEIAMDSNEFDSYDELRDALENVLGSGDATDAIINEIKDYPHEYTDLVTSIMVDDNGDVAEGKKTRAWVREAVDGGYDGVIFNDIIDEGVYGGEGEVADVYVALNSNQFKSVNNLNPTEDEDIRYSIGGVDNVVAFPQNGRRSDAGMSEARQDEAKINALRKEIREIEDALEFDDVDKKTRNRLFKAQAELDKLIAKERSLSKKTSIADLLDNLDNYRRSDLESLAEQISDGAWDDYEDLSDEDLRDGIREMLGERRDDMSPLEAQAAKYGYSVRPVDRYSLSGPESLDSVRLMRENQLLREKLEDWRGSQGKKGQAKVSDKTIQALTKRLINEYGTEMPESDIASAIRGIFERLGKGESFDLVYRDAEALAGQMVEQTTDAEDRLYTAYRDLRDHLKGKEILVSKDLKAQIPGYEALRKSMMGRAMLKNGTETNIDEVYEEAAGLWPEFFDEEIDTTQAARLERIGEVLRDVYNREATEAPGLPEGYLATEILASYFDSPALRASVTRQAGSRADEMRARHKERYDAALERAKEQKDKALRKRSEQYLASKKRSRERQKERELRGKILRHCKKLSTKLTTPTDTRHIPDGLQDAVAIALNSINLASKNSKDTNRTKAFAALQKRYQEILSEGSSIVIDPDLLPNISDIIGFADTPIENLGMQDLETIWRAVRAIEASISTANKALGKAKFETISQPAFGIRDYLQGRRDRGDYRGPIKAFDKLMNFGMLTPEGFFSRLGKSGADIFKMLRSAQDHHISIMQDAQKWANKLVKGWNIKRLEKETQTFDFDGKSVTLSKAQIMSLYELMKRQQAIDHIMVGGLRPETVKRGVKERTPSEPWHLTQDQVAEIVGSLSDEEVKLADEMQQYMEKVLAELGNEASLAVYGYKKFTEKHYFPIAVDKNETVSDVKNDAVSGTIAGWGSARPVKPNARNALIVRSIFDVFADHTTEMANYAAWLGPMENFNRIFNFRYKNEAGDLESGVKTMLERAFGKNGPAYWRQLQDDLNNGVHGRNDNPFQALIGAYKGSAIGANIRVIAQQPTAILRTLDEISPADFIAGVALSKPGKFNNVVKKYAPIAVWKDWGYFTADTGRQMRNVLFNDDSGVQKLNNFLMQGAGTADSVAWTHIWNAVEVETRRKRKDLKPGSEAFYEAVAERFGDIIDHTQVVDGILQRSQIMRSPDNLTKMATSFMAEPTKVYNMMTGALYDARNATGAERSKAMRKLARTSVALLASFVANAAAQSLVDALRDDDKDEEYWEKFFQAFWGGEGDNRGEQIRDAILNGNVEAAFNPATYIPWAKDIVSLTQGFNVSRMDMDTISRVMKEIGNTMRAMNGEGKLTKQNAILRLSVEMARFLGIPAANLKRDIMSGMWTIYNETHNYRQLYEMEKFLYDPTASNNQKEFVKILFAAQRAGDQEAYQYIRQDLVASGVEEKKLDDKLGAMMKDEMNEGGKMEEQYHRVYDAYEEIMKVSPGYQSLTAEQQEKVQSSLSNYATGKAVGEESGGDVDANTSNEAKAIAAAEAAGVDPVTWKSFKVFCNDATADKDENGESIRGSKKAKCEKWLKDNGVTGAQFDYCMEHYS